MRYVESDTALVNRVLGREVGGKQNILVFNDEAHHAYRIRARRPDEDGRRSVGEEEEAEEFFKEATVWVDGLDRIHKLRGINFCVDLSATPYFLGRVGQETNRPFPWVVSDFGLIDAIESGLVKIPQLAVRDTTGAEIPGYFNIWRWILPQLTPAERGGKQGSPKPEAILKWAHTPIAMLGGLWEETREEWAQAKDDPRPPVFILVCKNTKIAKVDLRVAGGGQRADRHSAREHSRASATRDGAVNTIRVDSKVVHETDSDEAKSDESRWMRLHAGHGRQDRVADGSAGRPDLSRGLRGTGAQKLGRPLHPPGRDVRCIVSVGMLTEGWDCNTVTHIIGLRPFMSQLLCEQVVGRGLRRASYEVCDDDGQAHRGSGQGLRRAVRGDPVQGERRRRRRRDRRSAPRARRAGEGGLRDSLPARRGLQAGDSQPGDGRLGLGCRRSALDPMSIPPEVEVKAALPNNKGGPRSDGPGQASRTLT